MSPPTIFWMVGGAINPERMKDKNKLIEVIQQYVAAPYCGALIKAIRPSIRLKTTGHYAETIGSTKLGMFLPGILSLWKRYKRKLKHNILCKKKSSFYSLYYTLS